jgi:hypothetical protein
MDDGQHWHEGALEQNSITDANIPVDHTTAATPYVKK